MMLHSSSSASATAGRSGDCASRQARYSCQPAAASGASQAMQPPPRSPGSCDRSISTRRHCSSDAITATTAESASIATTAASVMERLSGTTTPPALSTPQMASSISRLLCISTATRSPRVTPSECSPFATRLVPRSNSRHESARSPSTTAGFAPCHLPWSAMISGKSGDSRREPAHGYSARASRENVEPYPADQWRAGPAGPPRRSSEAIAGDELPGLRIAVVGGLDVAHARELLRVHLVDLVGQVLDAGRTRTSGSMPTPSSRAHSSAHSCPASARRGCPPRATACRGRSCRPTASVLRCRRG